MCDPFPVHVSDINELNLPKTCEINFPDDDDLLNFRLIISPDEVCVCVCMSLLLETQEAAKMLCVDSDTMLIQVYFIFRLLLLFSQD